MYVQVCILYLGVEFNTLSDSVHGFLQAEYIVQEGDRLDTMFQLNVKGMTQFGSGLFITGNISPAADGTASKQ